MSKVILDCQDVSKSYANEGIQNHVLKHIDLEIRQGEFTVIMGPSDPENLPCCTVSVAWKAAAAVPSVCMEMTLQNSMKIA